MVRGSRENLGQIFFLGAHGSFTRPVSFCYLSAAQVVLVPVACGWGLLLEPTDLSLVYVCMCACVCGGHASQRPEKHCHCRFVLGKDQRGQWNKPLPDPSPLLQRQESPRILVVL